jgi:hypothetical protein
VVRGWDREPSRDQQSEKDQHKPNDRAPDAQPLHTSVHETADATRAAGQNDPVVSAITTIPRISGLPLTAALALIEAPG